MVSHLLEESVSTWRQGRRLPTKELPRNAESQADSSIATPAKARAVSQLGRSALLSYLVPEVIESGLVQGHGRSHTRERPEAD